MVKYVKQRARESQRGERVQAERSAKHAKPQPKDYDADVLNAVVGQKAFEIVLCQRENYAQQP